jgi:endonuclease/exonuclease/phosphatase family metal-dependent hydrolase
MFRSRRLLDFRTQKLADLMTHSVTRKDTAYDHVAIDMGSYLATGIRICRDLVGPERDADVSRFIVKNVVNVILRKVQAKKSVAIFFDGTDPLWKTRKIRKVPHKKTEGRFHRSAGSPLCYVVEDKIRAALLDARECPPQVVISGAATPGPVEAKMSAWALDLAAHGGDASRKDNFCFFGGADMFLTAFALTPFTNATNMTLDRGDFKQLALSDVCAWFGIAEPLRTGDNAALARLRTDIAFLYLLTGGLTSTELAAFPNLTLRDVLEVYLDWGLNEDAPRRLFTDAAGGGMELDVKLLVELLSKVTKKAPARAKHDVASADYIEVLLQTHAMLCDGGVKDYGFTPKEPLVEKPLPLQAAQVIGHLMTLKAPTLRCREDPAFALTAGEQLLCGAITADMIAGAVPAFSGGHALLPGMAEQVVDTADVHEALAKAKDILKCLPQSHRSLVHTPTHFWMRKPGEAGPPPGWAYSSVNLGNASAKAGTRAAKNAEAAIATSGDAKKKNALVGYDRGPGKWNEKDTAIAGNEPRKKLTIVSWNVQFDRFSGKTTPLGKPGVDWCTRTRYVALSQALEKTDADIIAMQETEPTWWDFLSKQAWVQKSYMFSCPMKGDALQPWGQLLLINRRVPVTNMASTNVPGYTGHTSVMTTATLQLTPAVTATFSGVHLLAPYTQSNVNVRVSQIETLMKRLAPRLVGKDVIVAGDFNDYPSNFFVMPPAMGNYVDAWAAVHGADDGEAGYTINGKTSKYTSLIIEPEFYGRADRVLVKSEHLKAVGAELVGTASVRKQLNTTACPEYLFPSDHYGLKMTFDVIE